MNSYFLFQGTLISLLLGINFVFLGEFQNIYEFPNTNLSNISIFITKLNRIFSIPITSSLLIVIFNVIRKKYKQAYIISLICFFLDIILSYSFDKGSPFSYKIINKMPIMIYASYLSLFFLIYKGLEIKFKSKNAKKEILNQAAKTPLKSKAKSKLPLPSLLEKEKKQNITININEQKENLLQTLRDFKIEGTIKDIQIGPVVTLYSIELAPGIKSVRLINLSDDIARSMQAFSVRIANIPGKNLVGIEIANSQRQTVYFKEGIDSLEYQNFKGSIPICLGSMIDGSQKTADLTKMPHLLVAGTTGSGKSVAIHSMLSSILFKLTPSECKIILIDPKMLELIAYEDIPHLLLPVVTSPKKAVSALKWAVKEMEDRYKKMSALGVRNISTYNAKISQIKSKQEAKEEKMPFLVIVVDEFADLMMVAGKEIEMCVQRLAQMARAAGIHLIMATQRPSVDVITGTIKANFPTRISFKLSTKIDSRTILGDQGGAEQLLGQGDMLYLSTDGKLYRIHSGFISENDVNNLVDFWKKEGKPEYIQIQEEDDEDGFGFGSEEESQDEPYYEKCVDLIRSNQKVSTSFLQRNFPIGYNRAAKIIERMEKEKVISKGDRFGRNREIY